MSDASAKHIVRAVWLITIAAPAAGQQVPGPVTYGAVAHPPIAASARERDVGPRVTLERRDVPLRDVLQEIARQGAVELLYSGYVVPLDRRITISVHDVLPREALEVALRHTGISVRESAHGQFLLVRDEGTPATSGERRQLGTVTGRVTDGKRGEPLEAVRISLEGTTHHALTDGAGRYRLTGIAPGSYTLNARRIGYAASSLGISVTADQEAVADVALEPSPSVLDQVVVTGTVVPTERRALPAPITVLGDSDLVQRGVQSVDEIFRGAVAGSFAWQQPEVPYYSSLTIRGASSLGTNVVKTYVDGVEVANPLYLANIDPNSIDHIEITRGPQASTIYGSDAEGGVLQVFTKRGERGRTRPEVSLSAAAGAISGTGVSSPAPKQLYTLDVNGGGAASSYSVGGSYDRTGEWAPEYGSSTAAIHAGAEVAQGALTLHPFARYESKDFDAAWNPQLRAAGYTAFSRPPYDHFRVRQQTYGLQLDYAVTPGWHHSLTIGYDGTVNDFATTRARFTTPDDSLRTASTSDEGKASVRYNTSFEHSLGRAASTTIVAGAEYYDFQLSSAYTYGATQTGGTLDGTSIVTRTPYSNTGFFGQLQLALRDALYVTAGLRGERNANFGDAFGTAWSPRVGLSYVREAGPLTVKMRASYGEAIRAPEPTEKEAQFTTFQNQRANPLLGPERQAGWDSGLELYVGRRASLGVTYFDQTARDLIDLVLVDAGDGSGPPTYQYQNTGRIRNAGWEVESKLTLGGLQLSGTWSRVRSVVRRLDSTYTGDYRVGDRVLGVPTSTIGASGTYTPWRGTSLTATVTHAGHWRQVDVLALYGAFFGSDPYRGSNRAYWITYPAFTKVNLGATQTLSPRLTAFVQVDDVSGARPYENNNIFIPMGRSGLLGLRARF